MSLEDHIKDVRSPLAKLLGSQPIAHRVFEFDGSGGRLKGKPIAVRWLSVAQLEEAHGAAIKFLVEKCGWDRGDLYSDAGSAVLNLETKVRMLAVGLVDAEDVSKTLVKNADELRGLLDVDEVTALFEELSEFLRSQSPLTNVERWEEVEGFVTALGKGWTLPRSWNSYDADMRRFIITELAKRLYGPPTPSSSDTTQPSDSSESLTTEPMAE
jgi:hypothetical protein